MTLNLAMEGIMEKFVTSLPVLGILAFSLCSVNSIYHLLTSSAQHPGHLYYLPAFLVEIVTAWSVHQIVTQVRELTKSRISKQDRRFYVVVALAFVCVALPLVGTSAWANTVEFDGNLILGTLFPIASVGCAVGAALPQVAAKHEARKAESKAAKAGTKPARRRHATGTGAGTEPARYTETSEATRQRAREILEARPGISGSALGRKLDRSPRLGRKLKAELLPELAASGGNGRGLE